MDRNKTGVLALRWLPSPPLPPIFLVAGIPLGHSAPSRCWTDLPPFAPGADGSWSPTTLGRPSGASGKGFSGGWEPRCLACFPRRTFHGNGRGADRKSPRKLSKQLLGGPRSVSGAAEAQPSHRNPTSAKTQPPHAAPCSSRWRGPDLAGPESMMAHSQARKRFRSRSRSDSQSRRDVEEKEKKRRKSSKESQGRIRSLSPASKRGSEPPRVQMGSASSKEVKKKKKEKEKKKKRRRGSSSSSSSSSETSSLSSGSSSSSDSSPDVSGNEESNRKRRKQSKKKLSKEKDKKQKRKRKRKTKKKAKNKSKGREKEGETKAEVVPGPSLDQWQKETLGDSGPALTDEQKSRIQAMKPMTKEEWDARQSVIRRVVDPETGRTRLIKGDGEVLEEIVTKERHKEINKHATRGDGLSFQARMGMLQ
ncbi:ADP-ribosylation factor-like protein 6-interacting protein 4 [Zootoca vivipara]|uniref:ADP-ribosylation factor-like protein 6-interacting protein 4 n=1 Tax=Zootoca vivipara TaxID=8524 RepID=UPI00293B8A35|nr:ADP-ribosylation factor-like protein 6-interacting protein 4 [Zootoca vivipara]